MAELPEIMILTRQISHELEGKEFESVEVTQEKSLNMEKEAFINNILQKKVTGTYNKGKWIILELSEDSNLLLNLGMGADILYHEADKEWPDKYQCLFEFNDESGFTCRFWWFGHVEFVTNKELNEHKPTKDIAISPLDTNFTEEHFTKLIKGRSQIKNLILNQKKIGGIGNVYIHDILFKAKIHPQRLANSLKPEEISDLYIAMIKNLKKALNRGGLAYEMDFYGIKEGCTTDDFLVAYKEGEPCPVCGGVIEKIKTGSTSSYICPECQKL